ncbi:CHAT domain-containing protein [Nocardioides sp. GXZ039]|uniref:CHAT domain-containing protein n=1 Tax=Nocardioides sp. GXZ039 TaxID=3136018 RepID=UPI0030F38E82
MTVDLPTLAVEDPARAEALARAALGDDDATASERSAAQQALGIVLRDRGEVDAALRSLAAAVRTARRSGDDVRLRDVQATYGLTLVMAGHATRGLGHLDRALDGPERPPVTLMRRAVARSTVNRHAEAHDDLVEALAGFRRTGDRTWEAVTLHNLGYLELMWGQVDRAQQHTEEAAAIFADEDLLLDALWARQNLGEIAQLRGDLPTALARLDEVSRAYAELGHHRPNLVSIRSRTLLAAGLAQEAAELAEQALDAAYLLPMDRADLELVAATARLDIRDPERAVELADQARRHYRRLGARWFELRAELVVLRGRRRLGSAGRHGPAAARVATELHLAGADEAPLALTIAAELDRAGRRGELLLTASEYRRRGRSALVRASGWWAAALLRDDVEDRAGVLRACDRGLDALDEHRATLGSTELRALATGHGTELAGLALRHAARGAAVPRALLRWSERWRATALAQPPVTPGEEPVLPSLAALRDNGRRLAEARAGGEPTDVLEQERRRLEREVRAEHHRLTGATDHTARFDVDRLVAEVGDGCLVELVDVDGVLHVLVVHGGRVRHVVAGPAADALALTGSAAFALRRAARGRPFTPGDLGSRLQDVVLGPAARLLPDGPVTVVPTGRLHGVAWALLPVLADRPFGVVPSAAQWLRACSAVPSTGRTVLLAGPGLDSGGAEVPALARRDATALLLDGEAATVEAAMGALDGARLAHVAAHGRFRADSPLFSALELADGPLTVHDLERLRAAPHRVVLSACESGVLAPVGAEELLGLASALFALGTAGLVCSVAEVDDAATADLMVDLHAHLDAGLDPASALHAVRAAAPGDPTATAFVALGV